LLGPGFGTAAGNLCVNAYAFDPGEELISFCSCLVTPDQTVNLGVNADLTAKTLTGVVPTSVTVKLLSTLAGGDGTGTSCTNSAATVTTATPVSGLAAWDTTLHANPIGGYDLTEARFRPATLSAGELASIGGRCASILGNGSGFGVCNSCRAGAPEVAPSISGTDYLVPDTTAAGSLTTSTTGNPIAGTTITLTGTDEFGTWVFRTTTTNSSGNYIFANLNASNASGYSVTETPPAGDTHLGQTSTTPGADTTPATTPVVSNIVLTGTSTNNFFEVPPSATISTSQQPASATIGSSIADMATVSGGFSPTGTVTFNLYSSSTIQNSSTLLFTDANEPLVSGHGHLQGLHHHCHGH
jgi:hypothetical protein